MTKRASSKNRNASVQSKRPPPRKRPPPAASDVDREVTEADQARPALVIAGVGASAGGLEAFSQVLENLPANPGLALILVQHLAPHHDSALTTLLSARTPLRVIQAADQMAVEVDCVYVTPPNAQLLLRGNVVHLEPRPADRTQFTPVDSFLSSLAISAQDCSIAVILSGTASDGSAGVRDVKAVGGITIAQKPDTAKYDGMPRAAIASGFVDLVLSPAEIAAELVSIASHPLKRIANAELGSAEAQSPSKTHEQQMEQIFAMLRTASGVDFRRYKRPTIDRRLHRRLVLHKLVRLDQYIRFMRENPGEVHALYSDILIHVTRFYRDRDTLDGLRTQVLPALFENQAVDQPIRVWVPGCSTGEEAYTLAMMILDYVAERNLSLQLQIFATDISDTAIEFARAGIYSQTITNDVKSDELRRYFTPTEGGYRINKSVRDVCVFARQDLTRDPPFSKLDIILCRNVLIYMEQELQKRLMSIFHYALKPVGFLVLGSAETVGSSGEQFATIDRKLRIYQKRLGSVPHVPFPVGQMDRHVLAPPGIPQRSTNGPAHEARKIEQEASRIVQDRYAPPGVIVDQNNIVIQFRGQTGPYLEPAPGEPNLNLLKMAREGLLHPLRECLLHARKSRVSARKTKVRVRSNGGWRVIQIEVLPLHDRQHWLVLFEEVPKAGKRPASARAIEQPTPRSGRGELSNLQQELATSREYLQSIIQDLESANEELQSANEEVLSANEELQSTNEELDTAKEELQSTNEELNTVNEELHGRNDELSRVNSDLVNLLSSVHIPIVIVAADLRIRRFTPAAERVLNLIPGDVGRPISHIKPNIDCPDLETLIAHVIDTVTPTERQVQDQYGNPFSLRVRPYKNLENRIEGAVLALFPDSAADHVGPLRALAARVAHSLREPVAILDGGLRVVTLNQAFADAFGVDPATTVNRSVFTVSDGRWDDDGLRRLLDRQLRREEDGGETTIEYNGKHGQPQRMRVTARRIVGTDNTDATIVFAPERPRREQ